MERKFEVYHRTRAGEVIEYFVSDISEKELEKENKYADKLSVRDFDERIKTLSNEHYRPRVATFPVSQLYDKHEQSRRANMMADYMNKIQEVTNKAIAKTTLIDALSMDNST